MYDFYMKDMGCILSKFYIKPQQYGIQTYGDTSCILSKFYIKPQHISMPKFSFSSCILSKFYIKPQPSGLILIDKVLLTGCLPL